MKKPAQETLILHRQDPNQVYLVVDQEPRNWKSGVGVREMLPGGELGPMRIFDQLDMAQCLPIDQTVQRKQLPKVA